MVHNQRPTYLNACLPRALHPPSERLANINNDEVMATMVAAGDTPNMPGPIGSVNKRYRPRPRSSKDLPVQRLRRLSYGLSRSEHPLRKHTGESPFVCHCGKQFSRLDNLFQHAQIFACDNGRYEQGRSGRCERKAGSVSASGVSASVDSAPTTSNSGNGQVAEAMDPLKQEHLPMSMYHTSMGMNMMEGRLSHLFYSGMAPPFASRPIFSTITLTLNIVLTPTITDANSAPLPLSSIHVSATYQSSSCQVPSYATSSQQVSNPYSLSSSSFSIQP
ncbi:hypothetical protein BDQ12DRAFT_725507 [Crucibulum laeve]|uniref:C2H2-type domain-containing protein n=1 Tax=Crucibulum laeve TaxID=68775 RepID=A0A5C3LT56_9AGAR|nr:hypothetical protein BDQ12DRAFT_725507 [Crucibulum laeve]